MAHFSLLTLQLMGKRWNEHREASFVHYMEVTEPLNVVEKDPGGIFVNWSVFHEMDHDDCVNDLKHGFMKAGNAMILNDFRLL